MWGRCVGVLTDSLFSPLSTSGGACKLGWSAGYDFFFRTVLKFFLGFIFSLCVSVYVSLLGCMYVHHVYTWYSGRWKWLKTSASGF